MFWKSCVKQLQCVQCSSYILSDFRRVQQNNTIHILRRWGGTGGPISSMGLLIITSNYIIKMCHGHTSNDVRLTKPGDVQHPVLRARDTLADIQITSHLFFTYEGGLIGTCKHQSLCALSCWYANITTLICAAWEENNRNWVTWTVWCKFRLLWLINILWGHTASTSTQQVHVNHKELRETPLGAEGQGFETTQPITINAF